MSTSLARDRAAAALLVVLVHAAMLWLLIRHDAATPRPAASALTSFDVTPPPPPAAPPPVRLPATAPRQAAPAGLAGRAARRSPITAPSPIVVPPPSPVVAAIVPDQGVAAVGGTSAAGVGTGAASGGAGSGAGGAGDGTGGGGGAHARLLKGAIRNKDYPKAEREAQVQGTVTVAFIVGTNGRASGCRAMRSSGSAALDAVTCKLIAERFRYAPATNAAGQPIPEERGWQQRWWIADRAGD